jgi:hypothetical protein
MKKKNNMTLNDLMKSGIIKGNLKISIYTNEKLWGDPVASTEKVGSNFIQISDLMEDIHTRTPMDPKYLNYEIKDIYGYGINTIHVRLMKKGE